MLLQISPLTNVLWVLTLPSSRLNAWSVLMDTPVSSLQIIQLRVSLAKHSLFMEFVKLVQSTTNALFLTLNPYLVKKDILPKKAKASASKQRNLSKNGKNPSSESCWHPVLVAFTLMKIQVAANSALRESIALMAITLNGPVLLEPTRQLANKIAHFAWQATTALI